MTLFFAVFTQVLILMMLILIGAALTKAKIFTEAGIKSITNLVLTVVTPCVIIKSFTRQFDKETFKNLMLSFLIAFLAHLLFILISTIFIRDKDNSRERVLRFGAVFTNCGYMSLPLQQAILGDNGVLYGSAFIAIFNLFVWSYGIVSISGDKKYLTAKKMIINPGIIGLSIGLVIFIFSVPLPGVIAEPISYLAALNTPLPMMIIGYHLMQSSLIEGIKNKKLIFSIFLRIIVMPLAALGLMYICKIRGDMLVSNTIACSAPVAAITTMFASKFSKDTPVSVNMVSISTVLSLITMPLIITLAQFIA